jgi:demethylspheroidene O-methyltransferase
LPTTSTKAGTRPQDEAIPAAGSPGGWRERWQRWRDARLASAAFRRWASAFPLTRPIARRRAQALFDLMAGFVYSQVLLACVQLRVFDEVADRPRTAEELATRAAMTPESMRRLLDAAVSLRLLERRRGGVYGLGPLGAPLVEDDAIGSMVRHHAVLYADLRDPVELLRAGSGERFGAGLGRPGAAGGADSRASGGAMARYWPYADGQQPGQLTDEQVAEYSALMHASHPLVAHEVLAAYPLRRHRCVLDVGGGEGRFLSLVAEAAPDLRLMLFDLPAVAERARLRLAAAGLAARTTTHGGDFLRDPLPTGADLATLVRVLFDHPDERAVAILRAVRRALPAGGTVLVAEPMGGVRGAERMGDAYYSFYLLAMGRGQSRTPERHAQLLRAAGFERPTVVPTPMPLQASVIVATSPGS